MTSPEYRANLVGNVAPTAIRAGDVPVQKIMVGNDQVWPTEAAPPVEEPQELYAIEVVYKPNYVVDFVAKKGFVPQGDAAMDEAFMFRCVQMPKDGYVVRTFSKQWSTNGYGKLDCTLEDLYGDGTPAGLTKAKISFQIQPRP